MEYTSIESRTVLIDGKPMKKTRRVRLGPSVSYKEVTITSRGKTRRTRKPLTRKEIQSIKQCKFHPGLFNACELSSSG